MATVQIATLLCLTLLYSTQACDNLDGEGSNIDLSATCYNNGSVVYSWQFVRDADMLGNAEISYTCTTQQGNTSSVQLIRDVSVGVTTITVPSWSTGSSCVFEGCYVYSKTSAGFPTLAIPAATCSSGPILTSQLSTLTSQPAPTHTRSSVPMSSISDGIQPPPTTPIATGDAEFVVIFVPVVVAGVFVLTVLMVTLLLHMLYWKHQGSYQVDKDKINNYIANQPYDDTLPEPEGFTVNHEQLMLQQSPSVYSVLLLDQPLHTEVHSESEQEEVMSSGGGYVRCDLFLAEDIAHHLNDSLPYNTGIGSDLPPYNTGAGGKDCISPTFSDRSGYVDFCPP